MAYQNWFNQAANTSAVSSNVPPALVPSQSSVLDTQPVPSSYTTNRQAGSNISTMPQINQIMGVSTGGINTSMFPGTGPNSGGSGTGGGNAPSSWSGYSSGGDMTSYGGDTGGSSSIGQTSNIGTGAQGTMPSGAFSGYDAVGLGGTQTPGDWSNLGIGNFFRRMYDNSIYSSIFGSTTPQVSAVSEL